MLDSYRSHRWEFCLLRTLGFGFSSFVSSITRRVIRREVRRTCLAGARWVDRKASHSVGRHSSRGAGRGAGNPREESGATGTQDGLRGEERIFVFCFEIYKAVVEMRKLIISLPLPLAGAFVSLQFPTACIPGRKDVVSSSDRGLAWKRNSEGFKPLSE